MFLTLAAVTLVLFGITLALFRSFEDHRQSLGRSWGAQGQAALARHDPAFAVPALRAALSYAPDDRSYQLLLAEALAGSGHRIEATNYFLNLWTTRPGDGFVNLQLARLARQRGDANEAIEYYRAAIFGDWGGQGPLRRRACRLELAAYFVERHDPSSAHAELLLVASNAPDAPALNLLIGSRLAALGDLPGALASFKRALTTQPKSSLALTRAGAAEFLLEEYGTAEKLLERATRSKLQDLPGPSTKELPEAERSSAELVLPDPAEVTSLGRDAATLNELFLTRTLPAETRATHLARAFAVVQARINACGGPASAPAHRASDTAHRASVPAHRAADTSSHAPALLLLAAQWKASGRELRPKAMQGNALAQDELTDLIFTTMNATANSTLSSLCPALGDEDALLLLLARSRSAAGLPTPAAVTEIKARAAYLATGARL